MSIQPQAEVTAIPIQPLPPLPAEEMTVANSSASELRAAMNAADIAAKDPSSWGQMEMQPDGNFHLQLATGETFKGSANEVIEKLAEAQVNTKRWGQQWRDRVQNPERFENQPTVQPSQQPEISQPEQLQNQPAPVEQQAPGMDPADAELATYVKSLLRSDPAFQRELVSEVLGLPAESLPTIVDGMRASLEAGRNYQLQNTFMDFYQACPDYADTPQNSMVLVEFLPEDVQRGRIPTAEQLRDAHAKALYSGACGPAPRVAQQQQQAAPPQTRYGAAMIPSGQAAQPSGEGDWNRMSTADLGRLLKEQMGGGQ